MRVNNLSKVALDSAAAGIEPATSSRKSNALTTTPPSLYVVQRDVLAHLLIVSSVVGISVESQHI